MKVKINEKVMKSTDRNEIVKIKLAIVSSILPGCKILNIVKALLELAREYSAEL